MELLLRLSACLVNSHIIIERFQAEKARAFAQFFFNAQELVIFCDAISA
jgi:hypothetical protein